MTRTRVVRDHIAALQSGDTFDVEHDTRTSTLRVYLGGWPVIEVSGVVTEPDRALREALDVLADELAIRTVPRRRRKIT